MKDDLKNRIISYLNYRNEWIPKQELVDAIKGQYDALKEGITTDYIGRALRKMAEHGEINHDFYKGKKKQKLSKYAPSSKEKEVKKKDVYKIELRNGIPVAVIQ